MSMIAFNGVMYGGGEGGNNNENNININEGTANLQDASYFVYFGTQDLNSVYNDSLFATSPRGQIDIVAGNLYYSNNSLIKQFLLNHLEYLRDIYNIYSVPNKIVIGNNVKNCYGLLYDNYSYMNPNNLRKIGEQTIRIPKNVEITNSMFRNLNFYSGIASAFPEVIFEGENIIDASYMFANTNIGSIFEYNYVANYLNKHSNINYNSSNYYYTYTDIKPRKFYLPNNLKKAAYMFSGCRYFRDEIKFPDGIENVEGMLSGCNSYDTTITNFPDSIKQMAFFMSNINHADAYNLYSYYSNYPYINIFINNQNYSKTDIPFKDYPQYVENIKGAFYNYRRYNFDLPNLILNNLTNIHNIPETVKDASYLFYNANIRLPGKAAQYGTKYYDIMENSILNIHRDNFNAFRAFTGFSSLVNFQDSTSELKNFAERNKYINIIGNNINMACAYARSFITGYSGTNYANDNVRINVSGNDIDLSYMFGGISSTYNYNYGGNYNIFYSLFLTQLFGNNSSIYIRGNNIKYPYMFAAQTYNTGASYRNGITVNIIGNNIDLSNMFTNATFETLNCLKNNLYIAGDGINLSGAFYNFDFENKDTSSMTTIPNFSKILRNLGNNINLSNAFYWRDSSLYNVNKSPDKDIFNFDFLLNSNKQNCDFSGMHFSWDSNDTGNYTIQGNNLILKNLRLSSGFFGGSGIYRRNLNTLIINGSDIDISGTDLLNRFFALECTGNNIILGSMSMNFVRINGNNIKITGYNTSTNLMNTEVLPNNVPKYYQTYWDSERHNIEMNVNNLNMFALFSFCSYNSSNNNFNYMTQNYYWGPLFRIKLYGNNMNLSRLFFMANYNNSSTSYVNNYYNYITKTNIDNITYSEDRFIHIDCQNDCDLSYAFSWSNLFSYANISFDPTKISDDNKNNYRIIINMKGDNKNYHRMFESTQGVFYYYNNNNNINCYTVMPDILEGNNIDYSYLFCGQSIHALNFNNHINIIGNDLNLTNMFADSVWYNMIDSQNKYTKLPDINIIGDNIIANNTFDSYGYGINTNVTIKGNNINLCNFATLSSSGYNQWYNSPMTINIQGNDINCANMFKNIAVSNINDVYINIPKNGNYYWMFQNIGMQGASGYIYNMNIYYKGNSLDNKLGMLHFNNYNSFYGKRYIYNIKIYCNNLDEFTNTNLVAYPGDTINAFTPLTWRSITNGVRNDTYNITIYNNYD